jgi:putative hydrolase of the HAD superfamily
VPGAILLDALGTLVDFEDPAPLLRAALAERHGVEVGDEQARAAVRAEIATYRSEHGAAGDRAALAALRRRCAEVVRDALAPAADGVGLGALTDTIVDCFRFTPYPEVVAVLDELRGRGHPLAVVSNWDVSLHEVLERTGLRPYFGAVVVSAEIGVAKPDPEPFRRALRAVGAVAADALHAGDRLDEDVAGALAAGVTPVLVDRDGEASPAGGLAVVGSLDGLLDLAP